MGPGFNPRSENCLGPQASLLWNRDPEPTCSRPHRARKRTDLPMSEGQSVSVKHSPGGGGGFMPRGSVTALSWFEAACVIAQNSMGGTVEDQRCLWEKIISFVLGDSCFSSVTWLSQESVQGIWRWHQRVTGWVEAHFLKEWKLTFSKWLDDTF